MRQQIPNIITLLNLFLGCLAIVSCFQFGTVASISESGEMLIEIPEKLYLASLFIGLAAVVDFFDGYVARLLNVPSEMGKQLDSLADVVSFGVAPACIVYQF
jgi:CDP-diacylglycerol---serine O-phosphatidyltransferase